MPIILVPQLMGSLYRISLPGGVIGNIRDFGSLVSGSNPGQVAFFFIQREVTYESSDETGKEMEYFC